VLDAGAPKAEPAAEPETRPVTENPGGAAGLERAAQQSYLEGVIYFQKGDYEKARAAWIKARDLAPKGSDAASDARAGLEKLEQLYGRQAPQDLKAAPEKKDEHEALQTYFTGLIHYQKGDLEKARIEWKRALAQAPKGSTVESDAKAALEKLDKDEASTRRDGKK
jgi:Flp pilus assembly protein TadD